MISKLFYLPFLSTPVRYNYGGKHLVVTYSSSFFDLIDQARACLCLYSNVAGFIYINEIDMQRLESQLLGIWVLFLAP